MTSETSKCRDRLSKYCKGNGVDLGHGGDPITLNAIRMDMPLPYTKVGEFPTQLSGAAENLCWFQDESLDFVYSSHLLEDYQNTEKVLREWLRVIKPGGNLVLFCPDEQVFKRHCETTGQGYNNNHVHRNFSLEFVKLILDRIGETEIIHEVPLIDVYSWELVCRKEKSPLSKPRKTEDLILHMRLCPGDTAVMTAAVRDIHKAYPGRFRIDVRAVAEELFDNNPYVVDLDDNDPNVRHIDMHYDMIHQSNTGAVHFLHGFICHLERELGLRIPVTHFKGDIYLTEEEKKAPLPMDWDKDFWIFMAGGKFDNTTKWWVPERYQELVDVFKGCIQFVQCGELGHWHKPLDGVIDLRGKTSTREFVRLMYHAAGVVCPVTFAMHLAAAVPTKPDRSRNRPCVVIAGGREPLQWIQYPHHRVLATNGALSCCDQGGCWKSKCDFFRPGMNRGDLCVQPTVSDGGSYVPKCMAMISVDDVVRAIDQYHRGGVCRYLK